MSEVDTLAKAYEHSEVEARWYPHWVENGYFDAEDESDKPPYCIVIPPPNVTGSLHIGHALTLTIEDILTRWRRMQGYNTVWIPGTDHAGIATQMVVERELAKDGISRFDLGREDFVEKVWEWKARYHARITTQMQVLGVSVSWPRERFTMDEGLSRAVRTVFVKLYRDGLMYRANRLVNWSPGIHTVLSDLEVEHREVKSSLWHLAYPVTGSTERLIVATTRPETMLGDTAVAVHPDDPRYQHLIGKTIDLPLTGRTIPIIADAELVDMAFGSGAVKVTPAHDFNDFETGRRHNLEVITILDKDAKVNENAPEAYRGLDRFAARKRVVADLDAAGLLVKVEPHTLNAGHCQRTGVIVEPMVSTQWYVKADKLAEPTLRAVEDGRTEFTSDEWKKVYFHWMNNIKDWCVSRQLWWGHQIPAWYCNDCDHVTVEEETPDACGGCGSKDIRRDEDVLDTWFSSALWPFSTLGWPDETASLKTFYPNAVMETGFDIIFFWVARMMMMGMYCMGDVPFRKVFLHPMVRDEHGQKMSKTRNNVIDPLDVTAKHGADALRFTLASLTTQGHDLAFSEGRLEGYRGFCNKIWNATRFVFMNLEDGVQYERISAKDAADLGPAEAWLFDGLQKTIAETTESLEKFEFAAAASAVYQFVWNTFCDWYIELSKASTRLPEDGGNDTQKARANIVRRTLLTALDDALRMLHPFMPFITEELWTQLPLIRPDERESKSLTVGRWPIADAALANDEARLNVEQQIELIMLIRTIRGENRIAPKVAIKVMISVHDEATKARVEAARAELSKLANLSEIEVGVELAQPERSAVAQAPSCSVFVPLDGVVDFAEEISRLEKAIAKIDKDIEKLQAKLGTASFVANAPPEVVAEQNRRLAEAEAARTTYLANIEQLSR